MGNGDGNKWTIRQEMDRYLEELKREAHSRKSRVDAIKEMVSRGEYQVDSEKVAVKLIEASFDYNPY